MSRKRVAILISGRGSNMSSLIEAAASPDYPAEIVTVISNRADAKGLAVAAAKGVSTVVVASKGVSKADHEAAIDAALRQARAEIVCLAGYMRVLTPDFVHRWEGRLLNIHPSLLPLFPGLDTHRRAIEAGMRIHGCTVHFVTGDVDSGPIIAQAAVPVLVDESDQSLAQRVLAAEHRLYPDALALVASGRVRMDGSRVVFDGVHEDIADVGRIFSPSPRADVPDLESLARFTP